MKTSFFLAWVSLTASPRRRGVAFAILDTEYILLRILRQLIPLPALRDILEMQGRVILDHVPLIGSMPPYPLFVHVCIPTLFIHFVTLTLRGARACPSSASRLHEHTRAHTQTHLLTHSLTHSLSLSLSLFFLFFSLSLSLPPPVTFSLSLSIFLSLILSFFFFYPLSLFLFSFSLILSRSLSFSLILSYIHTCLSISRSLYLYMLSLSLSPSLSVSMSISLSLSPSPSLLVSALWFSSLSSSCSCTWVCSTLSDDNESVCVDMPLSASVLFVVGPQAVVFGGFVSARDDAEWTSSPCLSTRQRPTRLSVTQSFRLSSHWSAGLVVSDKNPPRWTRAIQHSKESPDIRIVSPGNLQTLKTLQN